MVLFFYDQLSEGDQSHLRSKYPSLSAQDSTRLFNKYYHARAKWYDIGLALGLSSGDLAALEQNHRGDCARCFEGVITTWLRTEGEKKESELSQAVKRSRSFPYTNILIIIINAAKVCLLALILIIILHSPIAPTSGMTTAAKALKNKYKVQPVVEFRLLHHATDMAFLNITLRNQSEQSVIKDIDSSKFLSEVDLKYRTEYIQPTDYSDSNKNKSLRIMIGGHPGAGKTALMRHIAKEWAEGRALQACEMLILIHLDRLSTTEQKPQSLSQLLQLSPLHGQLNNVEEVSKEIRKKDGAGVCFLFDSIDRWLHTDDFVHYLFFDSLLLRFSLCISTSRQIHTFRKQSNDSNIMYFDILGFNERDLNDNLHALTSDQRVISSLQNLWGSDSDIKDMCKLPLNMAMLIYITKLNTRQTSSIHTRTQLYSAFMYVTIKHYAWYLPDWNVGSLKQCIALKEPASEKELCTAFQHLHSVAFEMLIHKKDKFPEEEDFEINKNIDKLGFVSVTKVIHNEVKYTFYHQTFVEFFAAIHLLSVPQEERLYLYIKEQQSESQVNHNLWLFFFGLIGEHYIEDDYPNIIKQFAVYHSEQETGQFPPFCQNGRFLEYMKEIQWKGKKFSKLLSSAGIVVNSTLFTPCGDKADTSLNTLLYILKHDADIHDLKFDNIDNTKSDNIIDTRGMLVANVFIMLHHVLDALQLNVSRFVSIIDHLYFDHIMTLQDNSPSEINSWLYQFGVSLINESVLLDQNIQLLNQNASKVVTDLYMALEFQNNRSENSLDNIIIVTNLLESYLLNRNTEILQETLLQSDHTSLNASKGFSTYIHMTLHDHTDLHEKRIKWLNANSIVDYMLSGNILSVLFRKYIAALSETMGEQFLSLIKSSDNNEQEARAMLLKTYESILHATNRFWEALKTFPSHLDSLHLNNIELSCNDFPKLVERLQRKKIQYVFDLKIESQKASDSCQNLMSSLYVLRLTSHNIRLQKVTVIFPKGSHHVEFIPRQLQWAGLKHLSFHLPESLRESNCYKLIDKVSQFKELVTLEIQGCPLSNSSNLTRLPHTLQELTLGRSSLTDEDVPAIVELIDSKHELTSLGLPNNLITGSELKLLVKALKARRDFTLLDLSGNPIAVKNGLETLSKLSNLRELRLSNCNLGDEEVEVLVDALESNLNLHSLNLSGNPFIETEHGLEPLARLTNLHHLDISGSQHRHGHCHIEFDEECIENHTLIKVLEKLTRLRFLNLCSKNDPPIYWSKEMASVISQLPHLQVFNAPCLSSVDYDE